MRIASLALVLLLACQPPTTPREEVGLDAPIIDNTAGIVDALKSKLTANRVANVQADGTDAVQISAELTTLAGLAAVGTGIAFESNVSGCTLTPPSIASNAEGKASVSLTCTTTGRVSIRAVVDPAGLRTVLFASADIDFVQPPAAALHIILPDTAPIERGTFEVSVEARDAQGRIALSDTSNVFLTLQDNAHLGANIHGRARRSLVNGRTTFTGLSVEQAGSFVLRAQSASISGVSAALTIAPASLRFRSTGIEGGRIVSLAADPNLPGVFYASTVANKHPAIPQGDGNAFVSRDGGHNWQAIGQGLPPYQVGLLSSASFAPNEIYAYQVVNQHIPSGGLFRSTDGGSSWERVSDMNVDEIYVRRDRAMIWMELFGGPFISTDNGVTITDAAMGLPWIDRYTTGTPASFGELGGKFLVWTNDVDASFNTVPKLYRRDGDMWTELTVTGLPDGYSISDRSLMQLGDALVASVDQHIYCAEPDTTAFSLCETGLVGAISGAYQTSPGNLFAIAGGTLYRSAAPRNGWTAVATSSGQIPVVNDSLPSVALTIGPNGVLRSDNGGVSFVDSNVGLRGQSIKFVRTTSYMGATSLVAITENDIYRSTDNAATWVHVRSLDGAQATQLDVLPDGSLMALGRRPTQPVYFWIRSTDGGATWVNQTTTAGTVVQFAVDTSGVTPKLIALVGYVDAYSMDLDGTNPVLIRATEIIDGVTAGSGGYAFLSHTNADTKQTLTTGMADQPATIVDYPLERSGATFIRVDDSGVTAYFISFAASLIERFYTMPALASYVLTVVPSNTGITRIERRLQTRFIAAGRLFSMNLARPSDPVLERGDGSRDLLNVTDFAFGPSGNTVYVGTKGGVYAGELP